jgi:hypothetical protein
MAGMFSDAFAGLEGLEVEELEELKTAVEDLGKQNGREEKEGIEKEGAGSWANEGMYR